VLSAETVSRITEAVMEEARAWQSRPLDPAYAVVFLDAIIVKVRDSQVVQNKPACIAIGTGADGTSTCWASGWQDPAAGRGGGRGARFWAAS